MSSMHVQSVRRDGFTLPELLVVTGVIALLIAVLLPALSSSLRMGDMAKSQNNLRQIATWMTLYSTENREHIVPSQFDYSASSYPGKVRATIDPDDGSTSSPQLGARNQGTWTDILWTINEVGTVPTAGAEAPGGVDHDYRYDSPDTWVYTNLDDDLENPFRAAAPNSGDFYVGGSPGTGAKPFGTGAQEIGLPGYFAANDFFNARPNAPPDASGNAPPSIGRWYVTGQIKSPERSMYVVDSFAGETIEPVAGPYENDPSIPVETLEVDFRYNGVCLMLYMDGHSSPEGPWTDLVDLQSNRKIKVQDLDKR